MEKTPVLEDQWWGCYQGSLKGWIHDAAFCHPAKFARGLVERIYAHVLAERWAQRGELVLDPMCGVAVGAVGAANAGLRWLGIELERHFYDLGWETIALHQPVWERLRKPIPRIIQGDARNLLALVQEAGCVVSSPPYADQGVPDARHLHFDARRRQASIAVKQRNGVPDGYSPPSAIISSPPYATTLQHDGASSIDMTKTKRDGDVSHQRHGAIDSGLDYGTTPGQLGSLPMGDVQAIISSPPYADGCAHTGGADSHPELIQGGHTGHVLQSYSEPVVTVSSPPFGEQQRGGGLALPGVRTFDGGLADNCGYQQQGQTPGQLGSLSMGDVQAVISSPPYAEGLSKESTYQDQQRRKAGTRRNIMREKGIADAWYGESDGQIGKLRTGEVGGTYWSAMKTVYEQCYAILPVGGHIVLTLKGFIRKRQYVDLPGQTAQLLEHLGFTVLHMHRAMVISQVGQLTLEGEEERKSRKSFFRRLSEAKGAPAIDWETVLCAVKESSHAPDPQC